MYTIRKGSHALALIATLSMVPHLHAALLTGSVAPPPASNNLTTEGTSDWIHWGLNSATDVNHKATGGSQISNFTLLGTGDTITPLLDSASKYSWTDGTPTATATNSPRGVYINNTDSVGRGFQFTVPADLLARTLRVYVGEFQSSSTLTATLSDNSAGPYSQVLTGGPNTVQGVYTINYMAASAGQTLTVKWVETADLGSDNITIQAATLALAVVPEPAFISMLSLAALVFARRRSGSAGHLLR